MLNNSNCMKTYWQKLLGKILPAADHRDFLRSKLVRNRAARDVDKEAVSRLESLVLHTDCIAGLYYPTTDEDQRVPVQERPHRGRLPVPPSKFWHWYGNNEEAYLNGGKGVAETYRRAAGKHGLTLAPGKRILDFGCSGGRVLRWFEEEAYSGVECWGCDIDTAAIGWAQKNLMPPFSFFANSSAPHLPFRDGYFDLIYAGSIFTHIKDMATSWLLELARCLNKDGLAIITIVDEGSLDMLYDQVDKSGENAPRGAKYVVKNNITRQTLQEYGFISRDSSPWWLGTLYSRNFFIRRAGLAFDLLEARDRMNGFQSGYILRPRQQLTPPGTDA